MCNFLTKKLILFKNNFVLKILASHWQSCQKVLSKGREMFLPGINQKLWKTLEHPEEGSSRDVHTVCKKVFMP